VNTAASVREFHARTPHYASVCLRRRSSSSPPPPRRFQLLQLSRYRFPANFNDNQCRPDATPFRIARPHASSRACARACAISLVLFAANTIEARASDTDRKRDEGLAKNVNLLILAASVAFLHRGTAPEISRECTEFNVPEIVGVPVSTRIFSLSLSPSLKRTRGHD